MNVSADSLPGRLRFIYLGMLIPDCIQSRYGPHVKRCRKLRDILEVTTLVNATLNVDACGQVFKSMDRELWLITARAGDRQSGLIATFVSNASLVPTVPRVTVGLAKHHFTHELVQKSGAFCMHLIGEAHIDLVWRFGISSGREIDKLSGQLTTTSATGSPILAAAQAWLDCRVEAQLDTGDRTVFLAAVLDAHVAQPASPLTVNRMLELAPADKLQQLKIAMERDIETDHKAINEWRMQQAANG